MSIPATIRSAVWATYAGKVYTAPCYCCGIQEITVQNFHCGHIHARVLGGSIDITNLRPICSQCNTSMGTANMYDFAQAHSLKGRMVGEPRPAVQVEVKTAGLALMKPQCKGCHKSYTQKYLSQYGGWCIACFQIVLSTPAGPMSTTLRVPLPGDTECAPCAHCHQINAVVRK